MQLSIVTTLYQSASFVQEFYNRLTGIADELTRDYEIIFVVDGSPDDSLGQAVPIYANILEWNQKLIKLHSNIIFLENRKQKLSFALNGVRFSFINGAYIDN